MTPLPLTRNNRYHSGHGDRSLRLLAGESSDYRQEAAAARRGRLRARPIERHPFAYGNCVLPVIGRMDNDTASVPPDR
jgi:hypothetical protein